MVIVGGDRSDLSVRHRNLRVEGGEFQMLLVLLRAIVPARKRKDQRIIALQLAELAQFARVIRQLVVGKNASGDNVRTHVRAPPMGSRASVILTASLFWHFHAVLLPWQVPGVPVWAVPASWSSAP